MSRAERWVSRIRGAYESALERDEAEANAEGWTEFVSWWANYDLEKEMVAAELDAQEQEEALELLRY